MELAGFLMVPHIAGALVALVLYGVTFLIKKGKIGRIDKTLLTFSFSAAIISLLTTLLLLIFFGVSSLDDFLLIFLPPAFVLFLIVKTIRVVSNANDNKG